MKNLKDFKEFVKIGAVRKKFPDKSRAQDLLEDSDKILKSIKEIVEKIGFNEVNSNTIIKESHDVLLGFIRAKMLLNGFSASGAGAHEAEVSCLRELNFNEQEVQFVNQLRYFRNGIMYYGSKFDKEYAKKVYDFLNKIKKRF